MAVTGRSGSVRTMATVWSVALLGWSVFVTGIIFGSYFGEWPNWARFVAVQVLSFPVFLPALQFTYVERRPRLVALFAVPSAVAMTGRLVSITWPLISPHLFVETLLFGLLFSGAVALSWCVLGYAVGTARQWQQAGEHVPKRALARACIIVLFSSGFVFISQVLYWSTFVIGLGDSL